MTYGQIPVPGVPQNIDPEHRQKHRVPAVELNRYKAGVMPKVTAVCGKTWAPTFPTNLRDKENCPICFPLEQYRFAIAT